MSEDGEKIVDGETMTEQWKDIEDFENIYQISNLGNIKRIWWYGKVTNRKLHPWTDRKTGYRRITLCADGQQTTRTIHQLVLETFVGDRPYNNECRHLDGHKQNNQLTNLRWDTKSENQKDRKKHGNPSTGGNFKLNKTQVNNIRQLLKSGRNGNSGEKYTHRVIAYMFKVCESTITDIHIGRHWKGDRNE